jgi:hypothetical protein
MTIFFLSTLLFTNLYYINNNLLFMPRRDFLVNSNTLFYFNHFKDNNKDNIKDNNKDNNIDYYAHWSIYGLIPPPIEKTITYDDLLTEIKNLNIIKLQQAPQHDCIIATTNIGHRWSCLIKDKDIEKVNNEIRDINNNLEIFPIEKKYVIIRNIWQTWLATYSSLFFLSELGLIDIDLIGYSSISEKENMIKNGKKRKRLLSFISTKNESKNN